MFRRAFTVLILSAVIVTGCAKKETSKVTASNAQPLPDDVKSVATASQPVANETVASATSSSGGGEMAAPLQATGEFISPVRTELAAKQPGRVGRVFVDEGAIVHQGEPVLELETDYLRLDAKRAAADLARARAASDDAQRDFQRKSELKSKGSIPQAVYDRSQAMAEQAQAGVNSAAATLELSRQKLSDAVLRSPITGVVVERRADVGERLGDATVAFVISQTAPLKLRFKVPERYLQSLTKGQQVRATVDPYPNQVFTGTISVVGGVIDPATRTFFAEADFPNRDGKLRPGLFARVELGQ